MATLEDVAREAGLSVGTVSRVLNNRGYISQQSRERVDDAMKALHYRPNEMARSLSRQKTNIVGVIVPSIEHPYFAKLVGSLEKELYRSGYRMMLFCSQSRDDRESEYVEACRGNRVAGLIVCSGPLKTEKFRNLEFPLVTFERCIDEADAGIVCDNYFGGQLAARRFAERGCRKALFLDSWTDIDMPAKQREAGFFSEGEKLGIAVSKEEAEEFMYEKMDYYPFIRKALALHPDTDCIFATSDVIAAQVLKVCAEKNISVPGQMKVIGYDDVALAATVHPGLTTIRQPVDEMAGTAVSLVKRSRGGEAIPHRTEFPVSLVVRGSA